MIQTLLRLVSRGLRDLVRNPWAQLLTLSAVILVSFLAGLLLLLLHNLDQLVLTTQGDVLFQVYWRQDANMTEVRDQWKQLENLPGLVDKRTFTPEESLERLAKDAPVDIDLTWLAGQSPLPPTALLAFSPSRTNVAFIEETLRYLNHLPQVDEVHFNPLQSDIMLAWTSFSEKVILPMLLFLTLVLGLVVGNTIRLSLIRRQREVEILYLVGAKGWYIRLPLLVESGIHGLIGGMVALLLLKIVQTSLREALYFPPLLIRLDFLPFDQVLVLILGPMLAALISGCLALRRLNAG